MRLTTLALLCGLAAALPAQQAPKKAPSSPAQEAYQQLVADYETANKEYQAKIKELMATDEYKAAAAAKDSAQLTALRQKVPAVDRPGYAKRALDLAGQFTTDDSVLFYGWAVLNGADPDASKTAVAALQKDHLKSKALEALLERGLIIGRAIGDAEGKEFLDAVIAKNPHALNRAWALYWRAYPLTRGRGVSAEDKEKGEQMLAEAEKLAAGTLLAERIAAPRFEQERLQIGMTAPDIEGADVDGTPFKLSDYRGKVVVIDFWGFW
jgi:hypothetical protein